MEPWQIRKARLYYNTRRGMQKLRSSCWKVWSHHDAKDNKFSFNNCRMKFFSATILDEYIQHVVLELWKIVETYQEFFILPRGRVLLSSLFILMEMKKVFKKTTSTELSFNLFDFYNLLSLQASLSTFHLHFCLFQSYRHFIHKN